MPFREHYERCVNKYRFCCHPEKGVRIHWCQREQRRPTEKKRTPRILLCRRRQRTVHGRLLPEGRPPERMAEPHERRTLAGKADERHRG